MKKTSQDLQELPSNELNSLRLFLLFPSVIGLLVFSIIWGTTLLGSEWIGNYARTALVKELGEEGSRRESLGSIIVKIPTGGLEKNKTKFSDLIEGSEPDSEKNDFQKLVSNEVLGDVIAKYDDASSERVSLNSSFEKNEVEDTKSEFSLKDRLIQKGIELSNAEEKRDGILKQVSAFSDDEALKEKISGFIDANSEELLNKIIEKYINGETTNGDDVKALILEVIRNSDFDTPKPIAIIAESLLVQMDGENISFLHKWEEEVRYDYDKMIVGFISEIRLFSGVNFTVFFLLTAILWSRSRQVVSLVLPSALLFCSTIIIACIFAFGRDWFSDITLQSHWGWTYLWYLVVIFVMLIDWFYWSAFITRTIVETILEILNAFGVIFSGISG